MAEVLVLVEHDGGAPKKVTGELLTLARRLGEPSAVFLGAEGTFEKAKNYLAEYGAQKVYVAESNDLEDYLVAPKAEALASVISSSSPVAVLVAATPDAREAGARAAKPEPRRRANSPKPASKLVRWPKLTAMTLRATI